MRDLRNDAELNDIVFGQHGCPAYPESAATMRQSGRLLPRRQALAQIEIEATSYRNKLNQVSLQASQSGTQLPITQLLKDNGLPPSEMNRVLARKRRKRPLPKVQAGRPSDNLSFEKEYLVPFIVLRATEAQWMTCTDTFKGILTHCLKQPHLKANSDKIQKKNLDDYFKSVRNRYRLERYMTFARTPTSNNS
jgi:hypothetical protein